MNKIKVVFLGQAGVGKTSLRAALMDQYIADPGVTVSVDIKTQLIRIDNSRYRLEFWDTAGQEKFRSLAPLYYRDAHVNIVVYDISNLESYERAQYWIEEIRETGHQKSIIILVGNKLDLNEFREVPYEKVLIYSIGKDIEFLETSVQECYQIDELLSKLVRNQRFYWIGGNSPIYLIDPNMTEQSKNIFGCCQF
jgi:small GTP-binding protein